MTADLLERSRAAGWAWASRHPKKAAKLLVRLREQAIPQAAARGDDAEVARLEAQAEGITENLSDGGVYRLCRRCGAAIKDTTQPGWPELGPDCYRKEADR